MKNSMKASASVKLKVEQEMFTRPELLSSPKGYLYFAQVLPRAEAEQSLFFTRRLNQGIISPFVEELPDELRNNYKGDVVMLVYRLTEYAAQYLAQGHSVLYIYRAVDFSFI